MEEEEEIIRLLWQRSEEGLRRVQGKYGKLCFRIANNILKDPQDAQECENDGYLSLWNSIPPKKPLPLLPYLCRIVRNHALNRYEYRHAGKRDGSLEDVYQELDEVAGAAEGVESEIIYKEMIREISAFLTRQKEQKRHVFLARYYFAESVRDIASLYGISESKVKSILFRMRKELRKHLEEGGYL